ncbi:hypothetical protein LPJ81_006199, partial [Coemansia sp. IMI 209127]
TLSADKFEKYVGKVNRWARSLPLVFDNVAQELNLIAIIDLLQIGSGFRQELHEEAGRGASDTINFGCISLHISQTPLDAKGLQALTLGDISQHFGIPLFGKEKPMTRGISAVTVSEASRSRPLAEIIVGILQDTGRRLEQNGFSSFADFIIKMFGSTDPKFAFPDVADMTVFADNVVPAMLQHRGILIPCANIANKIKDGKELSLLETTAMRAASIVAAQLVADHANDSESGYALGETPVNQATLDVFWWLEGKDPELRAIP